MLTSATCNFIGTGLAWISPNNVTLDVRCSYEMQLVVANPGQAVNSGKILIDSVVLSPAIEGMKIYTDAGMSLWQLFIKVTDI